MSDTKQKALKGRPQELTLDCPDDFHVHFRQGSMLPSCVAETARQFGRALAMPNTMPPLTSAAAVAGYLERLGAAAGGLEFTPLVALYLTESTTAAEVSAAWNSGVVSACKLYFRGATTHADEAVRDLTPLRPVLAGMEKLSVPLCIHGELPLEGVDVFDREQFFIDRTLIPLRRDYPELRVIFEHITTAEAAAYVAEADENLGATITPQHLLYHRTDMLGSGMRVHLYCMPILKRERDRDALVEAATGDCPRFFLGTDSAPHARGAKESACGCAGCFSAPAALELYAQAFERVGRLDRLEAFSAHNGADFYRLKRNSGKVRLRRQPWVVPERVDLGGQSVVPLAAGTTLEWRFVGREAQGLPGPADGDGGAGFASRAAKITGSAN